MADEETLGAASELVREMARKVAPHYNPPEFNLSTKHQLNGKTTLPGTNTSAKHNLEAELSALASRIQYLENKANIVNHQVLPDTPNEFGPTSPFSGGPNGSVNASRNGTSRPVRKMSSQTRHAKVSNILAGNVPFTEEDLATLRDHVEKQAEEIKSQSETINEIEDQLAQQQHNLKRTFVKVEHEDIGLLERELKKHQQANQAFQKALKEIGIVITNVANGDLSKKVQIHQVEMDDEIVAFKRTINTMVDQLDLFGNEVSRVAKEVGTEGKLGGQAQITGVSGIWQDVTFNGERLPSFIVYVRFLILYSQQNGLQPN